ncbi:hypothetical protein, partial [Alistipes senegalensis]|uniref:hypothetical protein n=1 Tax=Alistipes senegalensis TaxID=1288121 RepID=UPI0018AA4D66
LLESRDEDGTLTLSVADPDLALYEGASDEQFDADGKRIERSIYARTWVDNPSAGHEVELTLRGAWSPVEAYDCARIVGAERDPVTGGTITRIAVACREGATREIRLTEKSRL